MPDPKIELLALSLPSQCPVTPSRHLLWRNHGRPDNNAIGSSSWTGELGTVRVGTEPVLHLDHDLHLWALLHQRRHRRPCARTGNLGLYHWLRRSYHCESSSVPRGYRGQSRPAQAVDSGISNHDDPCYSSPLVRSTRPRDARRRYSRDCPRNSWHGLRIY